LLNRFWDMALRRGSGWDEAGCGLLMAFVIASRKPSIPSQAMAGTGTVATRPRAQLPCLFSVLFLLRFHSEMTKNLSLVALHVGSRVQDSPLAFLLRDVGAKDSSVYPPLLRVYYAVVKLT
ncbi:7404_t:CDS:2, partial [Acaulospora colombiana]